MNATAPAIPVSVDDPAAGATVVPPRVVIDLEKLRHINCGLGRFSLHLGRELLRVAEGRFTPVLLLPRGAERYFPGENFARITVAPWRKEVAQRLLRPLVQPLLPRSSVALWHMTNQMSRYLPLDRRVPVLLTVHDLNFLHEAPRDDRLGEIDRKIAELQRKVDRATEIVTDSAYVADELATYLRLGDRPVHVVPLGLGEPPPASPTRPEFLPAGPFLFTVGNCLSHKNFHVLFGLLPRLPGRRLVIAGKKATPYGEYLEREASRLGLSDSVVMPGEVSDGDRQWLYEHCEAFFFPSLTEGFGFPVLEAMAAGAAVFCSRKTSLPEVAGDAAFLLDSFEPDAMATAFWAGLGRFSSEPGFADRARAHAAGFSWRATASAYAEIYARLLAKKSD